MNSAATLISTNSRTMRTTDPMRFRSVVSYHPRKADRDIGALGRTFEFDQWEAIFMEISQKYRLKMIDSLANESGFEIKQNFFDTRNYYCDSLWCVAR